MVGILVEEALDARGIENFGYGNLSKTKLLNSNNFKNIHKGNKELTISEDEFVDDSGYTIPSQKNSERSISTEDIELANKINILKESGLI